MAPPHWYKWVILCVTCLTTFTGYGYANGSTSIATLFYIQRYNERFISSVISSVNYAIIGIGCLPGLYLSKKIGNRPLQLIGGILTAGSTALMSLTTRSWQGLLLSGFVAGFGGGLIQIATTSVIKEYFPGRQIGPFGAISLTLNSASIVVPQLWSYLFERLGWQMALLTLGAILVTNVLCGLAYVKPGDEHGAVTQVMSRPRLTLIPHRSSSALFTISQDSVDEQQLNLENNSEKRSGIEKQSVTQKEEQNNDGVDGEKFEQRFEGSDKSDGLKEGNAGKDEHGMWQTLKQPLAIALLFMSGIYSGAIIACFAVMGDYAVRFLNMSDEQVANSLTIQGAMMIASSFVYIFLTACTEFCAILLHTISLFALGSAVLVMTFISTNVEFSIVVGVLGFFKSFTTGNALPLAIEMCGPEKAINLYVLKMWVDGFFIIGMPFAAVYIQETINERAALYFSAVSLFCAGGIFLPFIKRFLHKPRIKSATEVTTDKISTISHVNYYM